MSDIAERLRAACIDWNAAEQDDGELPRVELACRDLREAASEIEKLRRHVGILQDMCNPPCACGWDDPDDVCMAHAKDKS